MYCSSWKITWKTPNTCNDFIGGASLTYFTDRRVWGIFLGLKFWPKGIFLVYERCSDFILGSRKNTGIFWGIVLFSSSNQQWCTKCNLLLVWNFFGYAKDIGIFWSMQILKLRLLFYGVIKYEPLSDSPIIRISEWGPWELTTCTCNHV